MGWAWREKPAVSPSFQVDVQAQKLMIHLNGREDSYESLLIEVASALVVRAKIWHYILHGSEQT